MNLYKLHSDPTQLYKHDRIESIYPKLALDAVTAWSYGMDDEDTDILMRQLKDYGRQAEAEQELLDFGKDLGSAIWAVILYSTEVMNQPWPEAEEAIWDNASPFERQEYTDRWYPGKYPD